VEHNRGAGKRIGLHSNIGNATILAVRIRTHTRLPAWLRLEGTGTATTRTVTATQLIPDGLIVPGGIRGEELGATDCNNVLRAGGPGWCDAAITAFIGT
jgi:hypothetical protein